MLRDLPQYADDRLLVGSATADDAGVFQLNDEQALVQTVDFFTPIVDDPFLFGQIAAANSLSDVYAMGGRPITAMAVAGMPDDLDNEQIREIFRGGADKAREAKCSLVGGHTIKNPQPIYGLSVTGLVHPSRFLGNSLASEGDLLILSKPLGTGIVSTAIKKGICPEDLAQKSSECMAHLNIVGADISEAGLCRAATDVTGFGLLGHLREMVDGAGLGAEIVAADLPVLSDQVMSFINDGVVPGGTKKNLSAVQSHLEIGANVSVAHQLLAADAQTSGGLLLAVAEKNVDQVMTMLSDSGAMCAVVIGRITAKGDKAIVMK